MLLNLGGAGVEVSHPFGHYWFQVRSLAFAPGVGLVLELQLVRKFVTADSGESCWKCKARSQASSQEVSPVKIDSIGAALSDMRVRLGEASREAWQEVWQPGQVWAGLRPHLTLANTAQMGKLVLVLLAALLTGLLTGARQLAQFSLRLLHELANLVDRSTPLALGALNILSGVFSKLVGGAYLLFAMVWRDAMKPGQNAGRVPGPPSRSALPEPGSLAPPPAPVRQLQHRPASHMAAMDNMYSQGKNW